MKKVNAVKLNSANVKYDNSVDSERVYDIESNVNLQELNVVSFDGGFVKKDDVHKASFSKYGTNQLSVNFNNITDVTEMCAILTALNSFVEDVKVAVNDEPINL